MALKLITPPTGTPLTVEFAKEHSRVLNALEDSLIAQYLKAGIEYAQQYTARSLMPTEWRLSMPNFPAVVKLPMSPLNEVTGIEYHDGTAWQVLPDTEYAVDADSEPGRVYFTGLIPELIYDELVKKVRITYTAGYANAEAVPHTIKQAILMLADHFYINRSNEVSGTIGGQKMSVGADALLNFHKVY